MRRLTFAGAGRVEWREAPDAAVSGPLEAVIRPLVLGRCDLDVGYVRGLAPLAPGEPIGHETIGEVTEVGEGVIRVRPGQKVLLSAQICCGQCRMCRRGFTGRCESVPFSASYGMGRAGGYDCAAADLVRVPFADAMLVPLPEGADPVSLIGAADMALDAWRAVGPQLSERPGASVLVMGGVAQSIGVYAAGLAVTLGAGRVDYVDADPGRRAQAARYGVTTRAALDPADRYEIVVEAAGAPDLLLAAIRAAEPEGHVTSVAIHLGAVTPVPLLEMYGKGVFFRTGRANCRAAMEPLLAACAHGFDPGRIETRLYAFDDAPDAWMDPAMRTAASRA